MIYKIWYTKPLLSCALIARCLAKVQRWEESTTGKLLSTKHHNYPSREVSIEKQTDGQTTKDQYFSFFFLICCDLTEEKPAWYCLEDLCWLPFVL